MVPVSVVTQLLQSAHVPPAPSVRQYAELFAHIPAPSVTAGAPGPPGRPALTLMYLLPVEFGRTNEAHWPLARAEPSVFVCIGAPRFVQVSGGVGPVVLKKVIVAPAARVALPRLQTTALVLAEPCGPQGASMVRSTPATAGL